MLEGDHGSTSDTEARVSSEGDGEGWFDLDRDGWTEDSCHNLLLLITLDLAWFSAELEDLRVWQWVCEYHAL